MRHAESWLTVFDQFVKENPGEQKKEAEKNYHCHKKSGNPR
jgi:hypothetical protein